MNLHSNTQHSNAFAFVNISTWIPKSEVMLNKYVMFLEEIIKWIDKESPVDIIYLDFQKAFDKVQHQRLLLKLRARGIGDGIIDWIEQWLTDRRQCVVGVRPQLTFLFIVSHECRAY